VGHLHENFYWRKEALPTGIGACVGRIFHYSKKKNKKKTGLDTSPSLDPVWLPIYIYMTVQ
jgi:hypothetical protein